jgi:hypothetical protein
MQSRVRQEHACSNIAKIMASYYKLFNLNITRGESINCIFSTKLNEYLNFLIEHLHQITHLSYPIYFLSPLPIPYFVLLIASNGPYYSMDRIEGGSLTFE